MSLKINLGCGSNIIPGWENRDAECDISKPLPWDNDSVDFINAEHVVEHVTSPQALTFFEEAYRILKPGGVLRVTVPSPVNMAARMTPAYIADHGGTRNAALKMIVTHHGHQSAWSSNLLGIFLEMAGFTSIEPAELYSSKHPELADANGHWKVIGREADTIESICFEATK